MEIQSKLTRNRNNLAACLIGLRRFDEAEAELKGILATHPKCPLAHFNLGLLYEEEGRVPDAREAYTAEIELNPNIVPARFNLANLLLRAGDIAGAEVQLGELLKANPDEPRTNLFLARALLARSANPRGGAPVREDGPRQVHDTRPEGARLLPARGHLLAPGAPGGCRRSVEERALLPGPHRSGPCVLAGPLTPAWLPPGPGARVAVTGRSEGRHDARHATLSEP